MTFERYLHAATLTALLVVLGALAWVLAVNTKDSPKTLDPAVQLCRIVK